MKLSNKQLFLAVGTLALSASLATHYQPELSQWLKAIGSATNQTLAADQSRSDSLAASTEKEKETGKQREQEQEQEQETQTAAPLSSHPHFELIQTTFEQGVVMLHAKQYDMAITAFHRVIEYAPTMPEAHNNLGYALLGIQSYRAAQDFFTAAIDLNENLVSAYFGLALSYAHQDNLPLAIGAMETYRHLTTDDDPYLQQAYDHLQAWRDAGRG